MAHPPFPKNCRHPMATDSSSPKLLGFATNPSIAFLPEQPLHEPLHEAQAGLGNLAPAVVDGERVTSSFDLRDLGDTLILLFFLEGRIRDRPRHRVVLFSGDDLHRPSFR